MQNKPTYSIESVDHALRLALLLQQGEPVRVTEVAAELGVARSTAHRLLAMLIYRGFAEQASDRRYVAGPVLRCPGPDGRPASLRQVALPHLRELVRRCGETVNLVVLTGTDVRFVVSAECEQVLRVGDREGRHLPARLASGGLALLAALPDAEVERLYPGEDVDLAQLRRDLGRVRRQGFAVNDQRTEAGVTAIGCRVPGTEAAVSIAMPTARFDRGRLPEWASLLAATVAAIEEGMS